jgi:hypothetical protein
MVGSNPQDPPSEELIHVPVIPGSPPSPSQAQNQHLQQRRRAMLGPPGIIIDTTAPRGSDSVILDDDDDDDDCDIEDCDSRSTDDWWGYYSSSNNSKKEQRYDSRFANRHQRRKPPRKSIGIVNDTYYSPSTSATDRFFTLRRPLPPPSSVTVGCFGFVLLVLSIHRLLSLYMTHRQWINAPITYLPRTCPRPQYATLRDFQLSDDQSIMPQSDISADRRASPPTSRQLSTQRGSRQSLLLLDVKDTMTKTSKASPSSTNLFQNNGHNANLPRVCLTTLTDSRSTNRIQRFFRWRNFDGILELTWQNKYAYAVKHGYSFYDGSKDIDGSRPPAWSKVKVVQHLLNQKIVLPTKNDEPTSHSNNKCDWVMWSDADTVIMNLDVSVHDFLPADPNVDFLVGTDHVSGYNAGVFLVKNSAWGHEFMKRWWNMESYVRPPGFSLSGDNNAMKALLAEYQNQPSDTSGKSQFDIHVAVPARCTFNSFAKFLTVQESLTVLDQLEGQEWYMSPDYYHKGDFIAHTPGYDNKQECLQLLLNEAK